MLRRVVWIVIPLGGLVGARVLWRGRARCPSTWRHAKRGPIRSFVEEEGKTRVVDRYVVSAPVAGALLRVDLEDGDAVDQGQRRRLGSTRCRSRASSSRSEARDPRLARADRRASTPRSRRPRRSSERRSWRSQATEALEVAVHELERAQATWEQARTRTCERAGAAAPTSD